MGLVVMGWDGFRWVQIGSGIYWGVNGSYFNLENLIDISERQNKNKNKLYF